MLVTVSRVSQFHVDMKVKHKVEVIGQAKGHNRVKGHNHGRKVTFLVEKSDTEGEPGSAWPSLSLKLKRPTSIQEETSLPAGLLEGVQASEGQQSRGTFQSDQT